jgi:hypothetical protein
VGVAIHPAPGSSEKVNTASEEAIEGFADGAKKQLATANASPFSWNARSPTKGTRIGWILKQSGKEIANFAFSINPQAITRSPTTRTQMWATREAFYVDDFGAGPTSIQISQLLGTGVQKPGEYQTLRESFLQFYDEIWLVAAGQGYSSHPVEVFFYDNHLYAGLPERADIPEKVYFPAQGFQVNRSVSLNNVWQVQIAMVSLEKPSNPTTLGGGKKKTKPYLVKENETLKKIATKLAGRRPTAKQILAMERTIVKYNPKVAKNRTVLIYSPLNTITPTGSVAVKRNHVAKGQILKVPA